MAPYFRHFVVKGWAVIFARGWALAAGGERLQTGDECDVDDIRDTRAAGQVVDRGGQPLQQRPEGVGPAEALGDLVADVAGGEVGEDEHVRMAGDNGSRGLRLRHGFDDGRVELEFA